MKVSFARCAAALLLLCGLASPAWAGINQWTSIGPDLGTMCTLAAAPSRPSTVYAGVEFGGVYRSLDRGRTWTRASGSLGDVAMCLLGVDAADPDTVYGSNGQLFKSTDGGATWSLVAIDVPNFSIAALAVHPARSGTLFASSGYVRGIWRSSDGGQTWRLLLGSPQAATTLTVVPGRPDTLYAGTASSGVYRSTDGGLSWTSASRGLDPRNGVSHITFDPRHPQTLYLSPRTGPPFKSDDGGNNWRPIRRGFDQASTGRIAVDPDRPSTLYAATPQAGVYRSTDAGASWAPANANLPVLATRDVLAIPNAVLVGLYAHSVFRSVDDAASWSPARGINAGEIQGFAVGPLEPSTYYAADPQAGILKTGDRGARWTRLGFPHPQTELAGALAVDPVTPTTVYAALSQGIAKSLDGGRTWSRSALPCTDPLWIEIDPRRPSTLYAGGSSSHACGDDPDTCAVWKSTDAGGAWSCIDNVESIRLANDFDFDPSGRTLYLANYLHLYRSTDAGASWSVVHEGGFVRAVEIDPWNPQVLYAALYDTVVRSDDRGETWKVVGTREELGGGYTVVTGLEIDPTQPSILYAFTSTTVDVDGSSRVLKSTDSGETWTPLGQHLDHIRVMGLVIDPVDPSTLYARTDHSVLQITQRTPGECRTDGTTLCLGGRFAARVTWKDFAGQSGPGRTRPLTGDSGAFWFFDDDNVELVVKALDGRDTNGHFWVFYGALTNVEYTLVVTDTVTGEVRGYFNPSGRFASRGDTQAFRDRVLPGPQPPAGGSLPPSPCGDALCLGENGRFRVAVAWKDFTGNTGAGHASPLTGDSGLFWFFQPGNVELIVKVLDGRGTNGRFWFFYGALSSVEYTITVTDTATGKVKTYFNPSGQMASVGDMEAF